MNTKSPRQVIRYGEVRTKAENKEWVYVIRRRIRKEKRVGQMAVGRTLVFA
jgi:hypothetical protein